MCSVSIKIQAATEKKENVELEGMANGGNNDFI